MLLGEVIAVHVERALVRGGIYEATLARPILRGGGPADYFEVLVDEKFTIYRPK
ncbi:hypothetical protein [Paraburkholderia sp. JHI869]|uniref:hypothetical protein n=1 Tax=Paraburkholderia sp. JHI869 TaxID=3112959 RepID=UPI00316C3611